MNMQPSRLELSAEALRHNLGQFRSLLEPGVLVCCALKGNAYGHGLKEVATAIESEVDFFQLDDLQELEELRTVSGKEVLLLGYVPVHQLEDAYLLNAQVAVFDSECLRAIEEVGEKLQRYLSIQLKLDSLLGREGLTLADLPEFIKELARCKWVKVAGIYSHFANIEDTDDFSHAQLQIDSHRRGVSMLAEAGYADAVSHISASSGVLAYEKERSGSQMVRIGLGMYGLWPSEGLRKRFEGPDFRLKPALRWVTEVGQVKSLPAQHPIGYGLTYVTTEPTTIALIPQGYSDGLDRGLSNQGEVLIHGSRCRIVGRVAMNMFVADVSHLDSVSRGDEVVLLGCQAEECISAEELAHMLGTINYEVVTRISPLLQRVLI